MEFLIVIVLIVILSVVVAPLVGNSATPTGAAAAKLIIEKKKCPPHQWFWQEIVDQDGNKQGERIVCKVCGPLASQSGRSDEGSAY